MRRAARLPSGASRNNRGQNAVGKAASPASIRPASLRGDGGCGRAGAGSCRNHARTSVAAIRSARASEWQRLMTAVPPGEDAGTVSRRGRRSPPPRFHQYRRRCLPASGAAVVVLPLINQMNPSADVLALSTDRGRSVGDRSRARRSRRSFRKQPLFVRNLTPEGNRRGQCGAAVASCAIRRRWTSAPSRARRTG